MHSWPSVPLMHGSGRIWGETNILGNQIPRMLAIFTSHILWKLNSTSDSVVMETTRTVMNGKVHTMIQAKSTMFWTKHHHACKYFWCETVNIEFVNY